MRKMNFTKYYSDQATENVFKKINEIIGSYKETAKEHKFFGEEALIAVDEVMILYDLSRYLERKNFMWSIRNYLVEKLMKLKNLFH